MPMILQARKNFIHSHLYMLIHVIHVFWNLRKQVKHINWLWNCKKVSCDSSVVHGCNTCQIMKLILDLVMESLTNIKSKIICNYCLCMLRWTKKLYKNVFVLQVPRVFINGDCIGGADDLKNLIKKGKLQEMASQCLNS